MWKLECAQKNFQKWVEYTNHHLPEPKVTSSNSFIELAKSLKVFFPYNVKLPETNTKQTSGTSESYPSQ